MPLKVCAVTSGRSEYGYLYWPMRCIQESADLQLQLLVTGMHLSSEFGETWRAIVEDGFEIDGRIESHQSDDDAIAACRSIALGVEGFAKAIKECEPDILMVLGDRFEILPAVTAALIAGIPVAHLAGGDTSEGAFDESIRHAITKMAHIHFVTNAEAERRVHQMGEDPENVHLVGSSGLDFITRMDFLSRSEFFAQVGLAERKQNIVVTLHPTTLGGVGAADESQALVDTLGGLGSDVGIIITGPNTDPGGRIIGERMKDFATNHSHVAFRDSLGQTLYLNALKHCDVCVGNTSSGLYEAPSFEIPTVNIGDRQKGRLRAASVIDCTSDQKAIGIAILTALGRNCTGVESPYGDGHASERIVKVLEKIEDPKALLRKHFHEI